VRNDLGSLQVADTFACPCCERGLVDKVTRICHRCGVALPTKDPNTPYPNTACWPNLDFVGPLTDAARYKLDHAE
jgi:hypothetical protein